MGGETLAQLKRRVTACGFYSGPERMEAMFGRLGLENANARVWDQMIMDFAGQRLSFAPTRLDLADVEATPLRTRKARPLPNTGSGIWNGLRSTCQLPPFIPVQVSLYLTKMLHCWGLRLQPSGCSGSACLTRGLSWGFRGAR